MDYKQNGFNKCKVLIQFIQCVCSEDGRIVEMCEIDTEKPRNTDLHIFSYMPHQYALNSENQGVVVVLVNVAMH